MIKRLVRRFSREQESAQALVIFAGGLIAFCGFVAMSIDIGRLVWARTQMQAAVDAASLAAAQSMPSGTAEAEAQAEWFWEDNNDFLESADPDAAMTVTFPAEGNKRVRVHGQADIPTYFARIFGINEWHVEASGDAESQVLDIAVVLDISGSMCMTSYPRTEGGNGIYLMSPGRLTPSGGAFPVLAQPIASGGSDSIDIYLNDISIFNSTNSTQNKTNFGHDWNSSTRYWQRDPDGSGSARSGMIMIGSELFRITALNSSANRLTVTRAQSNNWEGTATAKVAHATGSEVWALRHGGAHGENDSNDYCNSVSYYTASSSQNGPHQPFDAAISNAQYFVSLFNDDYDKIGVATYSSEGTITSGLTDAFTSLQSSMDGIIFPSGGTNIADGIDEGMRILNGSGKRTNAVRVLVLLTDGVPTHYCSNGYDSGSCSESSSGTPTTCSATSTAITHAKNRASAAADQDIIVYTIGLGAGVLGCILEDIAELGGGEYVEAPTTASLDDAFLEIAEKTHIALIN
jgi:Mg-chelatase subunit ChlD